MTELRRNRIGFVFQSFALLPTFSAYENAELPLRIAGLGGREREERTWRCLEIVGIANRAHHRPYEMSGGQQQRVAIARALVNQPGLILADEPTGELDSTSGRKIMDLFQQISVEENVAVIMATHDPMVEEYAEAIYELKDGQIDSQRIKQIKQI
jgi:ABC-type lipoprotein export system ATPase subunit